jgi:hypothetical protein
MAKNKAPGDDRRIGAVKGRSQIKNPLTGTWAKRDDKGVREKRAPSSSEVIEQSVTRRSELMKRLAKR